MFTSQAHALEKYSTRRFSEKEVQHGWHINRRNIPRKDMTFPEACQLLMLPAPNSRKFDTSQPRHKHYWEW